MLENDITGDRRLIAKLLVDVILGKSTVLNALKLFPKNSRDPSVNVCFHILVHFESDEELRKKDALYKEAQDEFIVESAEALAKGEPLPANIIAEYQEYYGTDLIYHTMTRENIIKRLQKSINL